jgi:hypothetical protein
MSEAAGGFSVMTRFVIEGTWTGYTSAQQRVCHREVTTDKKLVDRLLQLHKIVYTDGTSLLIHVRPTAPRERIKEILGYSSLIRDAAKRDGNVVFVSELAS